jgi:hypothetical protein
MDGSSITQLPREVSPRTTSTMTVAAPDRADARLGTN